MHLVRVTVRSQDFVDMVLTMAKWLTDEGIMAPLSTYSGDMDKRNISFSFFSDAEGKRFAERFGGEVHTGHWAADRRPPSRSEAPVC
jgi:hypothetical protein